jgi:4-amino-4-deoxy-L-arabinose transferase-like glycosyltransferase
MQSNQLTSPFQGIFTRISMPANSFWLWFAIVAASLSFFFSIGLPSVGEEGVYTNITLEMLFNQEYLVPTLYGVHYSRPPLFNWLMLGVMQFVGVANVVIAARLVNIAATLATAWLLYKFVARKFTEKTFALFCCAAFLSGDLLFKRGWLAYADSLFALCVFAAMLALWLAVDTQRTRWLVVAVFSLSCAFLAKIHTAYIFYGITGLVLLWQHPQRKFLFGAQSWMLHINAILFPIAWTLYVNDGYGGVSTTWLHSRSFVEWPGLLAYATKISLYPLDVLSRFLPLSLLAVLAWFVQKSRQSLLPNANTKIIFWITFLNLLVYWLAPASNIRYILPLYPFIAMLLAYQIWHHKPQWRNLAVGCLLFVICLKYVYALVWLPYEHTQWRGDARVVAAAIQQRTQDAPLYTNDSTSSGLRVTVELNKIRYPAAPLTVPHQDFYGYVILDNNDPRFGTLVQTYNLRSNKLYLFFKAGPA